MIIITITIIITIKYKYRQLVRRFLEARLSKYFRNHTKNSLRKVSSPIKLETLSKDKPHNGHSLERSQTQQEHLSINQYSSWQLPLFQFIKPTP